jgi:hypothetical protein
MKKEKQVQGAKEKAKDERTGKQKSLVALWYIGIIVGAGMLGIAFIFKSWPLTILALVLGLVLKGTNQKVPLPAIYRDKGIKNQLFEGVAGRVSAEDEIEIPEEEEEEEE